ncbi:hypothetical protein EDL99_00345 [Ornithobacterium rhinotracheale]|uniref:hypothetical protein n=1 Tax=Ornithobacterium rhinotracheale TaxID=28251 RepID=UPI00129C6B83|nr:hypothetical protein [Ornithobacterium rhinotracheale]MRJ07334.1 hypothetical protein [Ornithobacterium rhinotracheale]UOH77935.1 hypothetical protein MT996_00345 [Ornithobacterium rhinotracheale]
MKKFLLFLITSVALVSCSSDDDSGKITKRCEFSTTYSNFYNNQKFELVQNYNRLEQSAGKNTVFEVKTIPPTCPAKTIDGREFESDKKTYRILFQIHGDLTHVNWSGKELLVNATPVLEVSDENKRVIGVYLMDEPSNRITATKKGNKWTVSYKLGYKDAITEYEKKGNNQIFSIKK